MIALFCSKITLYRKSEVKFPEGTISVEKMQQFGKQTETIRS